MLKFKLLCFCIVMLVAGETFGQQNTKGRLLLTTEKDQDGKYQDDSGKVRNEYRNARIADINSRIQIDLDKTAIVAALGKKGNFNLPPQTAALLESLLTAMQRQNEILKQFRNTLQNYNPTDTDPAKSEAFNSSMRAISTFTLNLLRSDSLIRKYYLQDTSKKLIDKIFPAVQRRIDELQGSLVSAGKDSASTIQLGAWMYHNNNFSAVHLSGFDKLPEGDYYVLDRWNIIPTEQQLNELTQLQALAKDNRNTSADIVKTVIKNYVSNFTSQLTQKAQSSLSDIDSAFKNIAADPASTNNIAADIETLKLQYADWSATLQSKVSFYTQLQANEQVSIEQFLLQLNGDISLLNSQTKGLLQTLQKTLKDLQALSVALQAKATALKQLLLNKLNVFTGEIKLTGMETLVKTDELNTAALEFSEEVFRLSLSDLPGQTELDLAYTGAREPGDRLVIKLSSVSGARQTRSDLETREIMLFRVLPHFEGTVGVIFAHPLKTTMIQKKFQMAPYYNLLFKGFWPWGERYRRRSAINNTLTDFSWGLHISSPDFNKDDVPELAVGLVISGFKDYLQIGFAHNIFENTPFWFFGVRLPVPAMNLGGSGNIQKVTE